MGILGTPLGWIMKFMYDFIPNYGVVLILFTLLVRVALFPLNVKQQKSSAKMALFNPKLQKLQKQFGKDKERYQQEMMKLYEEEGYNPMSSCLPMILQMVVLFGIIDVVYKPLKHLLSIPNDVIVKATDVLKDAGAQISSNVELMIVNIMQGHNADYGADLFNSVFSADAIEKIQHFDISFLGINLGEIPTWTFPVVIIPILSGVTSLLVSIFSMRQQKKNGMGEQQGMGMMKGMMYIMPLFSTWIAFSMPTGVGFYWIVSNVLSFVQTIVLYTVYSPEKMKAVVEAERAANKNKKKSRYKQAMQAAMEQQNTAKGAQGKPKALAENAEDGTEETKKPIIDPDEPTSSQIIAMARKRMADKYGDEYSEK